MLSWAGVLEAQRPHLVRGVMEREEMLEAGSNVHTANYRTEAIIHIRREKFVEKVGPGVRMGWLAWRSVCQRVNYLGALALGVSRLCSVLPCSG